MCFARCRIVSRSLSSDLSRFSEVLIAMMSQNVPLLYESCIKSIDSEADSVSNYYGEVLQQSSDLQTNACCTIGEIPDYMKKALSNVHDDVMMKYYGCGLVHPEHLKGASICDLGCGAGRDCYVLSQFVGEEGSVTGIDFNQDQLKVTKRREIMFFLVEYDSLSERRFFCI